MSRRKPHCRACLRSMQGHRKINGNLVCPAEISPTITESLKYDGTYEMTGRIMPGSWDIEDWMDGPRTRKVQELETNGTGSRTDPMCIDDDDESNPVPESTEDWPRASVFRLPSSEASSILQQAKDKGLYTAVPPWNDLISRKSPAQHGKLWEVIIGADDEAVKHLLRLYRRAKKNSSRSREQLEHQRKKNWGYLMLAGAFGGLTVWWLLATQGR